MRTKNLLWQGACLLLMALLSACGGGSDVGGPIRNDFTVSLSPTSLTINQGESGTTTLIITPRNGFTGTVSLSVANPQDGLTVSFNPSSLNVPDKTKSTVTVEVGSNVSPGVYNITLVATSDNIQKTAELTVTVLSQAQPDFTVSVNPDRLDVIQGRSGTTTLTITPVNGFRGTVSLSVVNPQDGLTVSFNPSSLNVPDKTKSTVTVEVGSNVSSGVYNITLVATSDNIQKIAELTVTVLSQAQPDFTVSVNPDRLDVIQGRSGTTTLTITPVNGFRGTVSLSVVNPQDGLTISFNPSSLNIPDKTKSTVTVEVGTSVRPGTYTLTFKASSDSIQRTATLDLTVQAPPDFEIIIYGDLTIIQGSSGRKGMDLLTRNSFTGTVHLSAENVPPGITVRFDPSSLNVTSDRDVYPSDILVDVGSNVHPGVYNITVVARLETIRKIANLKVDVDPKVGSTWTRQNSGTEEPLFGVTYGNGLFVAVGDGGILITSPNGVNWTGQRSGTHNTLLGVTYGNGLFVAVGGGGIILISSDGVNWREANSATENDLFKVTYGNGLFVAVGEFGTIVTSSDGLNWIYRGSFMREGNLLRVTYGNGTFVAVGSRGTILTSRDGVNWTRQNSPTTETFLGITYNNGTFVAVGGLGTLLTSRDGVNWTMQNSGVQANLDSVTYGDNGVWVVVGDQDDFSSVILTSLDTITWKRRETGTRNRLRDVTYGKGIFVVVGQGGTIFTSP